MDLIVGRAESNELGTKEGIWLYITPTWSGQATKGDKEAYVGWRWMGRLAYKNCMWVSITTSTGEKHSLTSKGHIEVIQVLNGFERVWVPR